MILCKLDSVHCVVSAKSLAYSVGPLDGNREPSMPWSQQPEHLDCLLKANAHSPSRGTILSILLKKNLMLAQFSFLHP